MLTSLALVVAGGSLIGALVALIVIGLLYWLCIVIPLPAPVLKIAYVIAIVAAVIVVINLLLGFGGHSFIAW